MISIKIFNHYEELSFFCKFAVTIMSHNISYFNVVVRMQNNDYITTFSSLRKGQGKPSSTLRYSDKYYTFLI